MVVAQCAARKPIHIVIPPAGVTIPCPVHPEGHFVKGREILLKGLRTRNGNPDRPLTLHEAYFPYSSSNDEEP